MARGRSLAVAAGLLLAALACGGGSSGPAPVKDPPASPGAARRFLTQATFGPTDADLAAVTSAGYAGWLDSQMALPGGLPFVPYMDARSLQIEATNAGLTTGLKHLGPNQFYEHFYDLAAHAPDSLRQRVAFALSQIFVVSMQDSRLYSHLRSAGSYYDLLQADCFGNFRTLLEDVSLHPAMGIYLSALDNQKEDPVRGRLPDENYAREVMQLFTIGLTALNPDGTPRTSAGQPIATYSHDDVAGLAKVFTGYGWYAATPTSTTWWRPESAASETTAMTAYPAYHSTSAKTFLGVTIPAAAGADPAGDLKLALDTLFHHPNVGPFLGTRLIQQLVTSNPSPAYVGRVAAAFNDNGKGVRGDLQATVKAVLLDPEARDAAGAAGPGYGKLREPVLRLTAWLRAFGATSQSGYWLMPGLDSTVYGLGQSPLNAPSVFNFWRPGYAPAQGLLAQNGLLAPEFQIVDEVSVAGYLNFLQNLVGNGLGGGSGTVPPTTGSDIACPYTAEAALADQPDALATHLSDLLLCGTMSAGLRQELVTAVAGRSIPASGTAADQAKARLDRAKLAVFLTMASPEFLHLR